MQGFQGQTRLLINEAYNQGDQIGRIFKVWLLFTWVFLKFYLNKKFQNTVCSTYLTFKSILLQLFSTFNLAIICDLAIVLATFPQIGRVFFKLLRCN